ncbi:TetR/AcrR family transcriptional regulator [Paenibacillus monticola]|uniref:TetR family transcriptional regulator n=1 Tax=Paenibacillus monticola TaxID=2666075 RepID=A0A7X2H3Z1_9BACL|nr:TetR/AcrR family transcriptional regulator [Paenibacillus monticola]MRN53066.1 TetR family transcriptional regulator [Paenibacillus monticola]
MVRTGRPRQFNREEAVASAMMLFWEYGFDSTSLSELKKAMGGISSASFYAAFESKDALFKEVLARYLATFGQVSANLTNLSLPPRTAIELTLRSSAKMQTGESHPLGCLVVLSASTCSPDNAHIRDLLTKERTSTREKIHACIERAVRDGELSETTDKTMLTTFFNTFLEGISTEARDGIPFEVINAAVTKLMEVWDASK